MTKGILYIVATPIGNLEDVTLRALRVLRSVSFVAAEDTRRTRQLLQAYEIQVPVISLHEHNEMKQSQAVIAALAKGQDVAYVTDAGTPGVSDPGGRLIRAAIAEGVSVVPIPGPSAVIAAVSVSGLPMDAFVFHGFLPPRGPQRRTLLSSLASEKRTIVLYETPRRVRETLKDIGEIWGDRPIALARELTKIHEEVIRGRVSEVLAFLEGRVVKGEITLVVGGAPELAPVSDDEITASLKRIAETGLSPRDRVAQVARELGISKRRVYELELRRKKSHPFS